MLAKKIQENLLSALKGKNARVLSVLRFLQSAIKNKEIEKKQPLTDEEIVQIIRKQIKELVDAKELFEKGGRADLVTENTEQITILAAYLPAEISDEELKQEVGKLIQQNQDLYQKNPKALIGICMNALKAKASPARIMQTLHSISP